MSDAQKPENRQAGKQAIAANQFTYFVAFDGTNNDMNNLSLTGDPHRTSAAQLLVQRCRDTGWTRDVMARRAA